MTGIDWEKITGYPAATYAGDRSIYKTQIVLQGNLSKTEEKKLAGVSKLTLFATLQKSNTYMLPRKDDDYDIEAIIVLRCELKSNAAPAEIAGLIHKVFPNPTIILFEDAQDRMGLSVAVKRKSKAEQGAIVVEDIQNTGIFDQEAPGYADFIEAINYSRLPQVSLYDFIAAMALRIELSKTILALGFYPGCDEADVDLFMVQVKRLETVQSEIKALQEKRRDRETTLAESTKIRMQIRDRQNELDDASKQIKELCHE